MGIGSHSDSSCTDSSAINMSAAVTRSPADSLCMAFSQCRSTVEGLMPSLRAICLDCIWAATRRRHSRSRAVRRSRTPFTVVSERSDPGRSCRSPCAPAGRTRSAVFLLVPSSVTAPARRACRCALAPANASLGAPSTDFSRAPASPLLRSVASSAARSGHLRRPGPNPRPSGAGDPGALLQPLNTLTPHASGPNLSGQNNGPIGLSISLDIVGPRGQRRANNKNHMAGRPG